MARLINYKEPESSFMTVEKDGRLIVQELQKNNRLIRLLYCDGGNALRQLPDVEKDITPQLRDKMFTEGYIRLRPKITVDSDILNYIIISFDQFTPNLTNPEFRDNIITFDIVCHLGQWDLDNMQLRPYRIAAEIDGMMDNKKLTGIGTTQFLGANQIILNDEFAGLTLMYEVIHGEEDKNFNQDGHKLISKDDLDLYQKDFDDIYKKTDEDDGWKTTE